MIADARRLAEGGPLVADVCIVGSGAAGTTTALELARSGLELIVLEAGGARSEPVASDCCRGVIERGSDHAELDLVRERRLGGTTTRWAGRCAPLAPIDFSRRDWLASSGWPISSDELRPYYERAHAYCGLGLFEYRAQEAMPGADPFVVGEEVALIEDDALWRWGAPVNFWRRFGPTLAAARNVRVLHHAAVTRLVCDPVGGSIERAVVAPAPGHEVEVEAKAFLLAAGGLECARLLLASGTGGDAAIGNAYDLVGRFYMTHPRADVAAIQLADPRAALAAGGFRVTRDGVYCRRMLRLRDEVQRDHDLLNLVVSLWYPEPGDASHEDPLLSSLALVRAGLARAGIERTPSAARGAAGEIDDFKAHLENVARGLPEVATSAARWARKRLLGPRPLPSLLTTPRSGWMRLHVQAEQSAESANRVTLSRERDAFGVPRLSLAYRVGRADRESIVRSLTVIGLELERLGVGRVEVPPEGDSLEGLDLGEGTDQLGATRMADSPRQGVVDARCRVFGVDNLRVASSSVFPTGGAVDPTLTIVALAIRAAEDIARELRSPLQLSPGDPAEAPTAA